MKRTLIVIFGFLLLSCSGSSDQASNIDDDGDSDDLDYRALMRTFVQDLGAYAKSENANFIVIPQNGQELVTEDGEGSGTPVADYLDAIDAVGREDLYYGYDNDNEATNSTDTEYMKEFLDVVMDEGKTVLAIDYCSDEDKMDDSYTQNSNNGYVSFAADRRALDDIPAYPASPFNENDDDITSINQAQNFLYLINPSLFATKADFITAVQGTNYDMLIMDFFFDSDSGTEEYEVAELDELRQKANGGTRLLISYMSIGEAEDYRYYWEASWTSDLPDFIAEENPDWPGNYKVRYWDADWQAIIFGSDDSYLDKIVASGFDGVYLDIIDAFEYFEI